MIIKNTEKQIWRVKPKQSESTPNSPVGYNQTVGTVKIYENLFYAIVYHAGHLVPTDAPISAADMIDRFIHNERNWSN